MLIKFSFLIVIATVQLFLIGIYISIIRINNISTSHSPNTQFTSKLQGNSKDESPKVFVQVGKDIFVYSAFLDVRQGRFVRIVGIIVDETYRKPGELLCNIAGTKAKATFHRSRESHSLEYAAVLISCEIPMTVSTDLLAKNGLLLEGHESQSLRNELNIQVKIPTKKTQGTGDLKIGVCVPPLFGNISPMKLIEFIEVTKIVGASHFIFYNYEIHDSLMRVLNMYVNLGDITMKPWKHNFTKSQIWYYGQSASIWDCLLDNMYAFDYIAFNDIDEFIVPRKMHTWQGMIQALLRQKQMLDRTIIAAFEFNSYIFKESSNNPRVTTNHYLQLTTITSNMRTEASDAIRSKVIINPRKVFELQIHHLGQGLGPEDEAVRISDSYAAVHHYRQQPQGHSKAR
ncbi:hypothetical protein DPMN_063353 [Dreissena polymorpha]|uniref:Glycosyltransferase family 92 protein n=1 Tax=Dreissena polymorpha TaxID=45954 RepID=A0A9D4HK26_DREPO|nr:hypothetical protein DPMN_063353 [Dreissena polymorpha]